MNLHEWNKMEKEWLDKEKPHLGKENRFFFWKENGREAYNEEELLLHFILRGGALEFAKQHMGERDDVEKED